MFSVMKNELSEFKFLWYLTTWVSFLLVTYISTSKLVLVKNISQKMCLCQLNQIHFMRLKNDGFKCYFQASNLKHPLYFKKSGLHTCHMGISCTLLFVDCEPRSSLLRCLPFCIMIFSAMELNPRKGRNIL